MAIPASELRRDVDDLLKLLRESYLLKSQQNVRSQQVADAIGLKVAQVVISNRVRYLRPLMKKLP